PYRAAASTSRLRSSSRSRSLINHILARTRSGIEAWRTFVIYFAIMRHDQISGLLVLAQDSLSKNPLGMFGIVKTLVGYFAASVGVRLDVEHSLMRLVLGFFFYFFHQLVYWVMERAMLGQAGAFAFQQT